MRLRFWFGPGLACLLCDVLVVGGALELPIRHAVELVLGAQIIATVVAATVLGLGSLVRWRRPTAGLGALAVTLAAIAAAPVPMTWSDGCNTHVGSTYAATAPYVLLARPDGTRLAFGEVSTLMACLTRPAATPPS